MNTERRKHPRFSIAQAIEIKFPKEVIFEAEGLDLSEDGMRIRTERHLEPDAKIFIMIQTGEGETDKFYFDGVAAWSEVHGKKI
ncbi:MAG: PilZ domain-containing protein, partial [Spirochaetota bacterium]